MKSRKQTRRQFLKTLGLGAAAMAMPRAARAAGGKKLNFVFVLADDLGWADLGCYGSRFYETPNLDRLAAGGMRFTDAYAACCVCSPTRLSILTGKYPARVGLTNWLSGRIHKQLLGAPYVGQMPLEEVTIAEALKAAGYATGFVGKWHLGGEPYWPEKQGFDVNVAGCQAGSPIGGYFAPWGNPRMADGPKGQYLTDRLTDEGLKFIESHKDKPFLLYQSYHTVHTPIQGKKELIAKYQAKAAKAPFDRTVPPKPEAERKVRQTQNHPAYAAMVESMDANIGRLLAKLDELGLAEGTVVFFMSDNGGLSTSEGSPTANVPLRAGKGWLYEGGIREPMIVRWPGVTRPGSACREPVTSTDFYPTILEMAGLAARPKQHADGVSLAGLLKGGASLGREAIYWHYPHYSPQGGRPACAVRAGRYKLLRFFEDEHVELYDLAVDLAEANDLAGKMPEKAAELKKKLDDWLAAVGAKMPSPNPKWKPAKGKRNA
ncbi:MAG TPA: sulfatase [Phycisphaerae bacterium]|nr:sulfatase [Phycisphaerae bacterium]